MGAQEKNDRIGTYDRMAQRLSTASTSWVGRGRGWGGGQVQAQGQAEGHGQGWDWFLWDRKVCVRGAFVNVRASIQTLTLTLAPIPNSDSDHDP